MDIFKNNEENKEISGLSSEPKEELITELIEQVEKIKYVKDKKSAWNLLVEYFDLIERISKDEATWRRCLSTDKENKITIGDFLVKPLENVIMSNDVFLKKLDSFHKRFEEYKKKNSDEKLKDSLKNYLNSDKKLRDDFFYLRYSLFIGLLTFIFLKQKLTPTQRISTFKKFKTVLKNIEEDKFILLSHLISLLYGKDNDAPFKIEINGELFWENIKSISFFCSKVLMPKTQTYYVFENIKEILKTKAESCEELSMVDSRNSLLKELKKIQRTKKYLDRALKHITPNELKEYFSTNEYLIFPIQEILKNFIKDKEGKNKSIKEAEESINNIREEYKEIFPNLQKKDKWLNKFYINSILSLHNKIEILKIEKDFGKEVGMLINTYSHWEKELLDSINNSREETKYEIYVEGITDQKILEVAKNILGIKESLEFIPSDGSNNIKDYLKAASKKNTGFYIGIYDFDQAFNEFNGLKGKWSDIEGEDETCLFRKNTENKRCYALLLPVPEHRKALAGKNFGSDSRLYIELLFTDSVLERFKCLNYEKCVGGGEIPNIINKNEFANNIDSLDRKDFESFEPLFSKLKEIINGSDV